MLWRIYFCLCIITGRGQLVFIQHYPLIWWARLSIIVVIIALHYRNLGGHHLQHLQLSLRAISRALRTFPRGKPGGKHVFSYKLHPENLKMAPETLEISLEPSGGLVPLTYLRVTGGYICFQVSFGPIYTQKTHKKAQEMPKMTHCKWRPSPPYLPTVHWEWWRCTTYIANNISSSANKYNNPATIIIKHQYLTLLFISLDTLYRCEDKNVE